MEREREKSNDCFFFFECFFFFWLKSDLPGGSVRLCATTILGTPGSYQYVYDSFNATAAVKQNYNKQRFFYTPNPKTVCCCFFMFSVFPCFGMEKKNTTMKKKWVLGVNSNRSISFSLWWSSCPSSHIFFR